MKQNLWTQQNHKKIIAIPQVFLFLIVKICFLFNLISLNIISIVFNTYLQCKLNVEQKIY